MSTAFTRDFGTKQGRIAPTGAAPLAGDYVMCLGYDQAGHAEILVEGDFIAAEQVATFAPGTKLFRVNMIVRPPSAAVLGQPDWRFQLLIDGVVHAQMVIPASTRTRIRTLSANVSKLGGGAHTIKLRLILGNITAPLPTSMSPDIGDPAGGGLLRTITGSNFTGATGGTAGGTPLTSFTVVNDTTITCMMPAHLAGLVDIAITGPGGTGTLVNGYEYFAPPSAGMTLRLRSTSGVTEALGLVSAWADQSGNGRNVQAAGAARPLWQNNSFNGRPGITYDGVDDTFDPATPWVWGDVADLNKYNWYHAVKIVSNAVNDTDSWDNPAIVSETSGDWGLHIKGVLSPFEARAYHYTPGDVSAQLPGAIVAGTACVLTQGYDGTDQFIRKNLLTPATQAAGNVDPAALTTSLRIGRSWSGGTAYLNFVQAEMIAYDALHDLATRTKIARYLMAEWGIS